MRANEWENESHEWVETPREKQNAIEAREKKSQTMSTCQIQIPCL